MLRKDIGDFLKQVRSDSRITQDAIAKEFGVTPSYISQIENGKVPPSEDILKNYILKFSLSLTDVYDLGENNIAFGNELRRLRMNMGLDIGQLEDLTGIDFFRIANFEDGIEHPTSEEIDKICEAFKIDPTHFEENEETLMRQLIKTLKKLGLSQNDIDNVIGYINKRIKKINH